MSSIKEETMKFLDKLPKINTANTYGSGFFTQGEDHEIQALDLIITVDNPNDWHRENYETNTWMYKGVGVRALFNHSEDVSFPKSFGAFFTNYQGRDYKLVVVDKRLLYNDMKTWQHFSFPGRFQKPMTLLVDNSGGILPELMRENYDNAIKVALLQSTRIPFEAKELYEKIAELSYLGDWRKTLHLEDPNKIKNIVNGACSFFEETYGNSELFKRYDNGYIVRKNVPNLEIVESLPTSLRDYIHEELSYKQIRNDEKLSSRIYKYFKDLDRADSKDMAFRCRETVGPKYTVNTFVGKIKKGAPKVKRRK